MSDARDALIEALEVERYTSPWWTKKADQPRRPIVADYIADDELTVAKRRRLLIETANEIAREATA